MLLMLRSRIPTLNPARGPTRRVRGCLGVERQEQFLGTPLAKILGGGRGRHGASPVKSDTVPCRSDN